MAIPLLPVAMAASSLAGQGINAWQTGRMNRKSRQFSREMYARQKADSLEFWNAQNAYNSPAAQMQRLKEAGLNPHLVYGSGADATSSSAPKTPSPMSAQFDVPRLDVGSAMNSYFQAQLYEKQLDQADANILKTYAEAEAIGYDNTVVGSTVDAAIRSRNADMLSKEANAELSMMARNVQRDMIRNNVPLRQALLNTKYLELKNARTSADISKVKADIQRIKSDNRLKQMDIELRNVLEGVPAGEAVKVLVSMLSIIFK